MTSSLLNDNVVSFNNDFLINRYVNIMNKFLIDNLFDESKYNSVINDLIDLYNANDYIWAVGYSGGKDSSLVVELVLDALTRIRNKTKDVFVLFTDTLIENPYLIENVNKYFDFIKKRFDYVKPLILTPKKENTFWYKIVVKGYGTPTWHFRWCTDLLKIRPMNNFLKSFEKPCIVMIGARYSESANRNRMLNKYAGLAKINKKKFTYSPIKDFATEEVWAYLLSGKLISGYDYWNLYYLYKDSAECPFQLDKNQNSCGNSRFGCHVCTVVRENKSINSLASIYPNLNKYVEMRKFLVELDKIRQRRYEESKSNARFTFEERKMILEKLKSLDVINIKEYEYLSDELNKQSTTQITHNLKDQENIAVEVLSEIKANKRCKGIYLIRGTEAHSGASSECEERIGERIKSVKIDGNYSHYELWLRFGKKRNLAHFSHHIGTTNSAAYKSTAVLRELIEAYVEAGKNKNEAPDIVVRSHRHNYIQVIEPSKKVNAISLTTPAWQLKTPFAYRQLLGRTALPQIGGLIIREGDEVPIYVRTFILDIERPKEVCV